ncbi:MAG: DUF4870 domain-containing protein [Planctomycetes bacterium]|nr:DUF4870 domain-containing protein [Planctomycetota bacterium]
MLCHVTALAGLAVPLVGNIVVPLIIWLIKREESPFVDDQGKEAVNFQITVSIAKAISILLTFALIGIPLLAIIFIAWIVLIIIATLRSNDGIAYRYPFAIRLIK